MQKFSSTRRDATSISCLSFGERAGIKNFKYSRRCGSNSLARLLARCFHRAIKIIHTRVSNVQIRYCASSSTYARFLQLGFSRRSYLLSTIIASSGRGRAGAHLRETRRVKRTHVNFRAGGGVRVTPHQHNAGLPFLLTRGNDRQLV